ncbi:hypothetical protein COU62_02420 [Candidatus Pacearchaeota archaeon CG10_big_fil_rev_8_21_14_0_10_35_219]|nr:hypothetical protein [Candidatus Pacearchaeota archaeon]OIO41994.1 MAG: hypothetical protein AUJ63_04560 [Candidatus Pacearchaeota archaeon CG1_02_35_32]PIO07821.1 MAG: hypothetical protein COU62_02420 [Candidatus Pacearchaeota archaeon CG10_big_fil_rev_8_21_14_0_10_35_219]PIZ79912.1 MAG: hypothetical protein COY00_02835 [Candidatus Pacearchaeota archaeon CG_4_10_14_0_2_um_filter_35_33]PJA70250.1 MAG: hypothetical protein CO155_01245 [Candidatus Pacearchaeota archaeon CG_4_9_14_3_um_filter_3
MRYEKQTYWIVIFALVIVLFVSYLPNSHSMNLSDMSMEEKKEFHISLKTDIQEELLEQSRYRCCLKKPCTYCIEKTPGHGEGATCDCLSDIVNGKHPCGECIGEILEGHGNPYLKEYFAEAIAEEVGMNHLDEIQKIIDEKYA